MDVKERKYYSAYIRNYLKENKPKDWNVSFWKFPPSSNLIHKYFEYIFEQNENKAKILGQYQVFNFFSEMR